MTDTAPPAPEPDGSNAPGADQSKSPAADSVALAKAQAEADLARAQADAARVAADQAAREESELASDQARARRDAAAGKEIAEANNAARKAATALDPELDRQQREAEARKSIAEADKASADAKRAQVEALIPDFSKLTGSETTVSGDQPAFSSILAHRALGKAVDELVQEVNKKARVGDHILVTDDPDLATSDAAFLEVRTGLERLIEAAKKLLPEPEPDARPGPEIAVEGAAIAATAGAVASALPAIGSMLSSKRTMTSFPMTMDNTAAVAMVAGRLAGEARHVHLDDFRPVPNAQIVADEKRLRDLRAWLWENKLAKERERTEAESEATRLLTKADELRQQLDAMGDAEGRAALEKQWREAEEGTTDRTDEARGAAVAVGMIDELVKTIDAFTVAIHTVPSGGKRSPFALAALREQLRSPEPDSTRGDEHGVDTDTGRSALVFNNVLFVKAASGSADQLFSDRPLWSKDRFHTIGSLSVAYWLMDTATGEIVVGGVATGSAQVMGKIGAKFTFTDPD